jgi:ATP synthase protein I
VNSSSPEVPIEALAGAQPDQAADSQATVSTVSVSAVSVLPAEPNASMEEYYQLQQDLLKVTLILTGIIFVSVWIFYSLNIALNYLLGACTGVVYLRLLARNVAQIGRGQSKVSSSRLALLVGVIIAASRLDQLLILPIFLGFMTYKAAVIFYMLQTSILPSSD